MVEMPAEGGFGLYLHWPFCQAKCPYCDFNSHVSASIDQARWIRAYEAEIDRIGAETGPRLLRSIFFGGGTPSLMAPETVAAILDRVRATWPMVNDIEITLEANPTSVEAGKFRAFRAAGVNRLSMGVQALNDADLKALGRMHSAEDAILAFDIAKKLFDRVSFDMIYSRQGQSAADWRCELRRALDMAVDHLSLYQLTIEPQTVFGRRHAAGKLPNLPGEDAAIDMWEVTQEICSAAGLASYETSNHARPGAESQHNLIYWRCGDYAGIGPGAHGRLTSAAGRAATVSLRSPNAWLEAVEARGSGEEPREMLSRGDQLAEFLLMGLRLREGVALERLSRLGGARLGGAIAELEVDGWLSQAEGRLTVTDAGRPVLEAILRRLLAS